MNIYEKLITIQVALKAPKTQFNSFGKYNYRSCEDILEAVKPLCASVKAAVIISDEVVNIGDRYYVKATAMLLDIEKPETPIVVNAFAREETEKKGADGSQITGASSSYARKYALNGLFCIDDTKDSDTTNAPPYESKPTQKPQEKKPEPPKEEPPKKPPFSVACPVCGKTVTPAFSAKLNREVSAQEQIDGAGGMCAECFIKKKAEKK